MMTDTNLIKQQISVKQAADHALASAREAQRQNPTRDIQQF